MDPTRFDSLTRQVSDSQTRRRVLDGALAGVLVGMLSAPEAEARRQHDTARKPRKSHNANRKSHKTKTETKPKSCDIGCAGLKAQAKSACKGVQGVRGRRRPGLLLGGTVRSDRLHVLPNWHVLSLRCGAVLRGGHRTVLQS